MLRFRDREVVLEFQGEEGSVEDFAEDAHVAGEHADGEEGLAQEQTVGEGGGATEEIECV